MSAFIAAWSVTTLIASTGLILLVLAVRRPTRRWLGPGLAYALWLLPAVRLILPALTVEMLPLAGRAAARLPVALVGPYADTAPGAALAQSLVPEVVLTIWLGGAAGPFVTYAVRHVLYCRRLRTDGAGAGRVGNIRVLAADVRGPLAFGVRQRCIAVPRTFATEYTAGERDLALAHEAARHVRGDLIANWVSIVVLALHWWNPASWIAIRAFRDDQEFATDAHVLAAIGPDAIPS